jgi:hypothetical protein
MKRVGASVVAAGVIGIGSIGLAGVGVGLAAASGSGTIHGCVAKSNGVLRVVNSSKDCTSKEKPTSFAKQGPQGPQGPPGVPGTSASSGTFQMFANVDGEGDLGSNYDATSAQAFNGVYIVTFTKPIGHCAIMAQSGKAGGSDTPHSDTSVVEPNSLGANPDSNHQVLVGFTGSDGNADNTPFMLTLTCTS